MKSEHACYEQLQPEIDRRQCAIYDRFEEQRSRMLAGGQPLQRPGVCERLAREVVSP